MENIVLITGATSGIGKATAKHLAENGFNLIVTGRRYEALCNLEEEILKHSNVEVFPLNFDIMSQEETKNAIQSLPDEWKNNISVLINNAGLALGYDIISDCDENDWNQMIDTNIKGLLWITKIVSKIMIKNHKGHIINVSSIAGKEVYQNGNVYCATKHAVESITKSLRMELLPYSIKVGSVSPGAVETEFSIVRFHGNEKKASKVYEGYTPLYAEDVAQTILFMVTRPEHVNINEITIMPTSQANSRDFHKQI